MSISEEIEIHRQFVLNNKWVRRLPWHPGECCAFIRIPQNAGEPGGISREGRKILLEILGKDGRDGVGQWNDTQPGLTKNKVIHYLARARNLAKERGL